MPCAGSATGWFWFAYTAGFAALGPLLAKVAIPILGQLNTLWLALVIIVAGALLILLVTDQHGTRPAEHRNERPLRTLAKGLTILWERPRLSAGTAVRTINSVPQYDFIVFMPIFFTEQLHFTLSQWLTVSSVMFFSNIVFNLISGLLGDRYGFTVVVRWMGGVGCAITLLAFYYLPLATHNYGVALVTAATYGATLAGFVPLSALMPTMAPDHRGASMAALNLGAGRPRRSVPPSSAWCSRCSVSAA